ncbi:8-oxo-dGDP phosphatase NUDT18 [Tetranychus urticae]|uniref:Nudix hydrolase domain-containing protein n=1 Tax=Tetranychus urticae TaxID=32264 RepID=T1L3H0_TETUR|nr:8-oxo-dGDP phosphatase NUDT18 [Tetranychus urticae]
MESTLDSYLKRIISGKSLAEIKDICDFSLKDQAIELKATKGIASQTCKFTPICKQNIFYIVTAVIFNEKDELLMMQEAKSECAGTWYLPAGRVEPGENLVDAVRREVNEETGLKFEPSTLILVENAKGNWYRFVFTGTIVGGLLKTVSLADSESLQASWISDINQLSLRCRDILPIIDRARTYWREKHFWHRSILPVIQSHDKILLRLIMVIKKKANNRLHVLSSEKDGCHLPVCEINPIRSVHATLKRFVQYIFNNQAPQHRPHGVLSIEHSGFPLTEKDGLCLTLLVSCVVPMEQSSPRDSYSWQEVNMEIETQLLDHLTKNRSLAFHIV